MAGARHGGAEAFFTRLALALHRAGLEQEVVIRRDRERAETLRGGGLRPHELAFGGPLDLLTPLRLRLLARSYRPDLVLTWMNRATIRMPAGPWRHVARLGGYYDLKYYRRCDHLVGNTPDIVRHIIAADGRPTAPTTFRTSSTAGPEQPSTARRWRHRREHRCWWHSADCIRTRRSTP